MKTNEWPSKVCDNCKMQSYTLAIKEICPYCNENLFIERALRNKNSDLKEFVKKYKVNITSEQIKNINLLKKI